MSRCWLTSLWLVLRYHGFREAGAGDARSERESCYESWTSEQCTPSRKQLACVLVHGFNGDPAELRELEERLRAEGYVAETVLLPGHGSTTRDFAATRWDDWYGAVLETTRDALERHERVVLIGHSLGGALVLAVAAHEPRVSGVVALCPPVRLRPLVGRVVARVQRVVRYVPSGFEDLRDRRSSLGLPRQVYRWTPLAAVHSLYSALEQLRADLPGVRCPTLVLCARHDHVVPMRDGLEAYALIGADEKELVVLERSFHQVTRDVERENVYAHTLELCRRVSSASAEMLAH